MNELMQKLLEIIIYMHISLFVPNLGPTIHHNLPQGQRTSGNPTSVYNQQLHIKILPIDKGCSEGKCGETKCGKCYQISSICILTKIEDIQHPILMYSTKIVFFICDFLFKPQ